MRNRPEGFQPSGLFFAIHLISEYCLRIQLYECCVERSGTSLSHFTLLTSMLRKRYNPMSIGVIT
jgi:hypothetical protein